MIEEDVEQGTPRWFDMRARVSATASDFGKIVNADGTPRDTIECRDFLMLKVSERCLDRRIIKRPGGNGHDAERGKIEEPNAAAWLEQTKGLKLRRCGFFRADDWSFGCSPDRVVEGKEELVEIKCPREWTDMRYMLVEYAGEKFKSEKNKISWDDEYWAQIQGQLWITGYKTLHFFAWHPEMPDIYRVVKRDEPFIKAMAAELQKFHAEVQRLTKVAQKFWPNQPR